MKIEIRIKYTETLNLEIIGAKEKMAFPTVIKIFLFADSIERRPPFCKTFIKTDVN